MEPSSALVVNKKMKRMKKKKLEISELPQEMLMEIFSRLPLKSVVFCGSVSKTWYRLANDPFLTALYLTKATEGMILHVQVRVGRITYPSNIMHYFDPEDNFDFTTFDSHFNDCYRSHIVGSCNGLLCLAETFASDPVYIWNPNGGEYLILPKAEKRELVRRGKPFYGFGFDPIRNHYKVVRMLPLSVLDHMTKQVSTKLVGEIHTLGSEGWRSLGDCPYSFDMATGLFLNGNLHYRIMGSSGTQAPDFIGAFNLSEENFLPIPLPHAFESNRNDWRLGVLADSLCIFDYKLKDQTQIWMMMDYGIKESWSKKYVIDQSFFNTGVFIRQFTRPLRILNNGEILLLWNGRILLSYDPVQNVHRDLGLVGLPRLFNVVPHVPSFLSLSDIVAMGESSMRRQEGSTS